MILYHNKSWTSQPTSLFNLERNLYCIHILQFWQKGAHLAQETKVTLTRFTNCLHCKHKSCVNNVNKITKCIHTPWRNSYYRIGKRNKKTVRKSMCNGNANLKAREHLRLFPLMYSAVNVNSSTENNDTRLLAMLQSQLQSLTVNRPSHSAQLRRINIFHGSIR